MSKGQYAIAVVFMIASITHVIVGFYIPTLPAWKMFKHFDRFSYELRDRDHQQINIRDHVQKRAYVVMNWGSVQRIAEYIALEDPNRAPLYGHITVLEHGADVNYQFLVELKDGRPETSFLRRFAQPPYPPPFR